MLLFFLFSLRLNANVAKLFTPLKYFSLRLFLEFKYRKYNANSHVLFCTNSVISFVPTLKVVPFFNNCQADDLKCDFYSLKLQK